MAFKDLFRSSSAGPATVPVPAEVAPTVGLLRAMKADDIGTVRKYLASGADPNFMDDGLRPLHLACGAACSGAPVQSAKAQDRLTLAQLLISNGAHVNAASAHGYTALFFAVTRRSEGLDLIKYLIRAGADVNAIVPDNDGFPERIWESIDPDSEEELSLLLLDSGLDVCKIGRRETFLMKVKRNENVAARILQVPGVVEVKDRDGRTALHIAAGKATLQIFSLIFVAAKDYDALFEADDQGYIPLFHAAMHGNVLVIITIANKGHSQSALNVALMFASAYNRPEAVEVLVGCGADLTSEVGGKTPLQWAMESGQDDAARMIRDLSAKARAALQG